MAERSGERRGLSPVAHGGIVPILLDRTTFTHCPCTSQLLRVHSMALFSPMLRLQHNLMNVVFILDLSQLRSLSVISHLHDNFIMRGYPVRWGFVPETAGQSTSHATGSSLSYSRPSGLNMARVLYYVERKFGRDAMTGLIQGVC